MHAATTIFREEGLLGLWSGAAPTVMRNGTNQMCLFWAKNNFDGLFFGKEEGDGRVLAPWQSMLSGFSAACLGPVATGPFDVIKVSPFGPSCPSLFLHKLMRCASQCFWLLARPASKRGACRGSTSLHQRQLWWTLQYCSDPLSTPELVRVMRRRG